MQNTNQVQCLIEICSPIGMKLNGVIDDAMGIKALQYYLQNGIIQQKPSKLYYILAKTTSEEFMTFADSH